MMMEENSAERDGPDRISKLPEHTLHDILCFLSQKEAARTSILSKTWRGIWCTRPKIEFSEPVFEETIISILNRTLQGLHDQKLSVQEFKVEFEFYSVSTRPFLEKWIPVVLPNMGVEKFRLAVNWVDLPEAVLEAKSLRQLSLETCRLFVPDKVLCKNLTTLYFKNVHIDDKSFQRIISSCPLIEDMSLFSCEGLRTIKINQKLHYLKHFNYGDDDGDLCEAEIHLPSTLETISITGNADWFHDVEFPKLKSLYLSKVALSRKWFDGFSRNFPVVEELTLEWCYGFEEFQLLSRSIKLLSVRIDDDASYHYKSIKAAIEAPNVVSFDFSSHIFTPCISFATTLREWKSNINLGFLVDEDDDDKSIWFRNLNELLKALSQSEISLEISQFPKWNCIDRQHPPQLQLQGDNVGGGDYMPAVVEHLKLGHFSPYFAASFLNGIFHVCHPKYIDGNDRFARHNKLNDILFEVLVLCRNRQRYFWQKDLEEVKTEALDQEDDLEKVETEAFDRQDDLEEVTSDENGEEWLSLCRTSLSESAFPNNRNRKLILFHLKWREPCFISFGLIAEAFTLVLFCFFYYL